MIYDGTKAHENGASTTNRVLDIVRYNDYAEDVSFIGYMNGTVNGINFPNGTTNSTSKAEARANISDSAIKAYVDAWYEENIKNPGYEQYVADVIYCNERNISALKTNGLGGDATENTGFASNVTIFSFWDKYDRETESKKTLLPDFFCKNINDRFTKENDLGNGKLKYPIGLLTFS